MQDLNLSRGQRVYVREKVSGVQISGVQKQQKTWAYGSVSPTSHPHSVTCAPSALCNAYPSRCFPDLISSQESSHTSGELFIYSFIYCLLKSFLSYSLATSGDKLQDQEQAGYINNVFCNFCHICLNYKISNTTGFCLEKLIFMDKLSLFSCLHL